ncbi:sugar nucleotide-binding protein [Aquimarina rhabdastrellae]
MKRILILGASGFIGNALYKELHSYYDTYGTYYTPTPHLDDNQKFFLFDQEKDTILSIIDTINPSIIIASLRGNFAAQITVHLDLIDWCNQTGAHLIFLSSANVFDSFINYPSYEYDKTFSESVYGRFKIKIENALMRMPKQNYVIARIPMIFGATSPRVLHLKNAHKFNAPIEVFPNVIINATTISKLTQQLHYIINKNLTGIYHLGSTNLIHHYDLIIEFCNQLILDSPIFKQVYSSNNDRYLAVLPKDNLLPNHLQITIEEVIDQVLINKF